MNMSIDSIPLPPPWQVQEKADGSVEYFNPVTCAVMDKHPLLRALEERCVEVPEIDKQTAAKPSGNYSDFRCEWKEVGLFGDRNSYGLTLRYYDDGSALVRMDGVRGEWQMASLQSQYGALESCDLFIGAKIKLFGRTVTVASAAAAVCAKVSEDSIVFFKVFNSASPCICLFVCFLFVIIRLTQRLIDCGSDRSGCKGSWR